MDMRNREKSTVRHGSSEASSMSETASAYKALRLRHVRCFFSIEDRVQCPV